MIDSIINLCYPAICQICGKKISAHNKSVCGPCLGKIKKRVPPFCIKCGRQTQLEEACPDCKKGNIYFDRAVSVFYYDDVLKGLVHKFKYKKITSIAERFVESMTDFMKECNMAESDVIISIPMHPVRLFKREINPSHVLANGISRKLMIGYSYGLLKKTKNTMPQAKLKRHERIKNVRGSFSVRKNKVNLIKSRNILLVDDLFTTGSTVNECARVLKEAGSGRIEVVTLARGDSLQ